MNRTVFLTRRSSRGQIIVIFSLFFALLFVSLIALVVNLSVVYTASTQAHNAVIIASESGANDINLEAFYYNPTTVTLASDAQAVCQQKGDAILGRLQGSVSCQIQGSKVVASATVYVPYPLPILGSGMTVHATTFACPVMGTQHPIYVSC